PTLLSLGATASGFAVGAADVPAPGWAASGLAPGTSCSDSTAGAGATSEGIDLMSAAVSDPTTSTVDNTATMTASGRIFRVKRQESIGEVQSCDG
ncbi:MAG: hypothetical protein ACXWDA_05190, partial [Aeromicrobium sp.]